MAVLRKNKVSNYTVIDNTVFKDKTLSLKAKGLLCLMLSLPDDWDYTLAGLATLSADGIDATRSALDELEKHLYFKRNIIKENGRYADVEYIVSEIPMLENPILENQILENTPQLNTNKIKENIKSNIEEVVNLYNTICTRLRKKERVTFACRKHIGARLKEYTIDEIKQAFYKVNESDFCCGKNDRGWEVDFDWLMKNNDNIAKVLDGKYDNKLNELEQAYMEIEEEKNNGKEYSYDCF